MRTLRLCYQAHNALKKSLSTSAMEFRNYKQLLLVTITQLDNGIIDNQDRELGLQITIIGILLKAKGMSDHTNNVDARDALLLAPVAAEAAEAEQVAA